MIKLPKIIFIHGNGGSTVDDNWFPWLKVELKSLGFSVVSKTFPDNKLARIQYWIPFLKDDLKADENSIIIGHSSGAVAALRYAEFNKIYGTILVAASYTDLGEYSEKISGFFDKEWNWETIKNNQKWIIQFTSIDDPYIPIKEARFIHEKLGTEYFEHLNSGHFGWDTKRKEFPELLYSLKSKFNLIESDSN